MRRFFLTLALVAVSVLSFAQRPQQGAMPDFQQFRRMMDWAGFNRYAKANQEVTTPPLAVFMGDSITDNWGSMRPSFFTDHNYICRGIGAQTVEQMLARFQADVVDLHPQSVVIMAGVNNIAGNNGKIELENIVGCLKSMCEIAKANGIIPILCSLTPCDHFTWNQDVEPGPIIIRLNAMLKDYAAGTAGVEYVDYHSPLTLPGGGLSSEDSEDGCHPTHACYEKMEAIIVPEIERILAAASRQQARPAGPPRQMGPSDWGNFKRYEPANAALTADPLVVLMGDSITDFWYDEDSDFFTKNNFAGRGISGQTASQMLVRFKQDVIDLHPKAVAIMAGTNDLCQNLLGQAYYPDQTIFDNITAMCELAEKAGIKVLLCSITPCAHYMAIPEVDAGSLIVKMNQRLKAYADSQKNVTYVDYHTPIADAELGLPATGTYDGIHPAVNLYDDMERILTASLRKVLKVKTGFYTLPADEAEVRKLASDAKRRESGMPMTFEEMVEMVARMMHR
jgi:lysophospholipase L1-like esterase